jgi:hypothetical protein
LQEELVQGALSPEFDETSANLFLPLGVNLDLHPARAE